MALLEAGAAAAASTGHGDLEDSVSELVLQSIRHRLRDAFQNPAAAVHANARGEDSEAREGNGRQQKTHGEASEELRRAKIEGALSWIRTELLEMRQQDCQLAKSLLQLGKDIRSMRAWREPGAFSPARAPASALRASDTAVPRALASPPRAPGVTPATAPNRAR